MEKVNKMTIDALENLIEQKILEILGDPETDLNLREDLKKELKARLKKRLKLTPHQEVMKRFG